VIQFLGKPYELSRQRTQKSYHTFQPCESVEVICSAPHNQIWRHQIAYAAGILAITEAANQSAEEFRKSGVQITSERYPKIRRLCGVHETQNLILTSSEDFFSFILIVRIYLHPLIELKDLLSPRRLEYPSGAFGGICQHGRDVRRRSNRSACRVGCPKLGRHIFTNKAANVFIG
jgi:hypothetical protein